MAAHNAGAIAATNETCLILRILFDTEPAAFAPVALDDATAFDNSSPPAAEPSISVSAWNDDVDRAKYFLLSVVNPALCVVGLIGNTMNIVVMTRRRMRSSLDGRMEIAARTGLVSLAAADMLCCAVALVTAIFGVERTFFRGDLSADRFRMSIVAYGPYVQNAFARASTWLTVVTAVGRYFAICRPLQTRHVAAEPQTTRVAVVGAFSLAALMELPTAWTYHFCRIDCPDGSTYFSLDHGPFGSDGRLRTGSTVFGAIVGYLLPAAILSFCTARLLAALREAVRISRSCQVEYQSAARSEQKKRGGGGGECFSTTKYSSSSHNSAIHIKP